MSSNTWNANLYNNSAKFVTDYGNDIVEILAPQANEKILDLGCGTGELTNNISQKCLEAIGIDFSKQMISKAQANFPNIKFNVADAQKNLNFEKNYFDAVFSNAAMHWMLDAHSVIKNVNNILKLGGRFVFEMGGKGNIFQLLKNIDSVAEEFGVKNSPIKNYYPSIAEYASLLENNGFNVEYALLFKRPTKLDSDNGIVNWTKTFRTELLEKINDTDSFFTKLNEKAKHQPELYRNGEWHADYVRLRIIAYKN